MSEKQNILIAFAILGVFTLLLFIIFGDKGLADLNLLKKEKNVLIEENKKLEQENLSLYSEIDRLKHDPEFVENIARQKLGVIGKEEVILKVKNKNGKIPDE
ncbi:MAG: septum formation initiator family protein [Deltaproteobacteria bacterium]|nr:septum formation initiator family protein [Deltaproteobacteria bacterium]